MERAVAVSVLAALCVFLGGCQDRGIEPPQPEQEPVSFSGAIQPIFSARCLACHAPGGIASFMQLTEDQSYASLVDQPAVFSEGKRVAPGDPDASALYNRVAGTGVSGGRMPPPPTSALDGEDVELIRLWIAEGAENN